MGDPSQGPARVDHGERRQSQHPDRPQDEAGREEEPATSIAPHQPEPSDREGCVGHGQPERDVPERKDGDGEREGKPEPWTQRGQPRAERGQQERPVGGIEGQRRGHPAHGERGECRRDGSRRDRPRLEPQPRPPTRARTPRRTLPPGIPKLPSETSSRGTRARLDLKRRVDRRHEPVRQVGPRLSNRRRPRLDLLARLERRRPPERMVACQGFPQEHADRPHVRRRPRLLAVQALRRDIGKCAGDVSDRGQRLRVRQLREPEVEEADRNLVLLRDEHVRGLHVAVHDAVRVREGEPLEHLCGGLDGAVVAEEAGAESLSKSDSRHVLVRDVQVLVVHLEAVRTQATGVTEPRRRLGLSLRSWLCATLPGDDLEGDLGARRLVQREPDRPRSAASERAQGPVATENEAARRDRFDGARHPAPALAAAAKTPAPA